jgi:hypothetical protein
MVSLQTCRILFKNRSLLLRPSVLKAGSKLATPENIVRGTKIYLGIFSVIGKIQISISSQALITQCIKINLVAGFP